MADLGSENDFVSFRRKWIVECKLWPLLVCHSVKATHLWNYVWSFLPSISVLVATVYDWSQTLVSLIGRNADWRPVLLVLIGIAIKHFDDAGFARRLIFKKYQGYALLSQVGETRYPTRALVDLEKKIWIAMNYSVYSWPCFGTMLERIDFFIANHRIFFAKTVEHGKEFGLFIENFLQKKILEDQNSIWRHPVWIRIQVILLQCEQQFHALQRELCDSMHLKCASPPPSPQTVN